MLSNTGSCHITYVPESKTSSLRSIGSRPSNSINSWTKAVLLLMATYRMRQEGALREVTEVMIRNSSSFTNGGRAYHFCFYWVFFGVLGEFIEFLTHLIDNKRKTCPVSSVN